MMYLISKRIIDLLIATFALIVLLPILIPISIILLLTGEHHIFYFQKRIGYKNKMFDIWKFATMLKNSPNMGTGSITLRNDSRVLPIGKFLRKTKINELPQIINVLKGDMSIVGPRPLVEITFNMYPEDIRNKIYDCKPGVTGIGSIVFRDEEKLISEAKIAPQEYYHKYIAPYKAQLEVWYQEKRSLITDIKIIFLTAWIILFPKSNLLKHFFTDLPIRNF